MFKNIKGVAINIDEERLKLLVETMFLMKLF